MITVVAAIIEHNARVLICQRRRDMQFPLKWEFPGGKVERGEWLEAALLRELKEELGVDVAVGRELYRTTYMYPGRPEPIELIFFQAKIRQGMVGDEFSQSRSTNVPGTSMNRKVFEQVKWVAPAELGSYDFLEANARLISGLAAGSLLSSNDQ